MQDGTEPKLVITVTKPEKTGEGINSYISYLIITKTSLPAFSQTEFSVIRRFNDFVWLHQHLYEEFPGLVVPPLPEKLLVGRFSPEFVENRRRALERFLNRTAAHQELCQSESFKLFLEADDDLLRKRKGADKQSKKSRVGGLVQWMNDTVQQVSTSFSSTTVEKTAEDLEFEAVSSYIDGLEPHMQAVFKQAQGLVQRKQELGNSLFEFGQAFTLLGQAEAGSLGDGMMNMGKTADALSVHASRYAEKEAQSFEEPIHDYIRIIGAVKEAMAKRNQKKVC